MNYEKIYLSIIEQATKQVRNKNDGNYYERHHIVPKSFGGTNKKDNLVLLKAREHFLCHLLLVKINKQDKNKYKKMLHAFMLLKGKKSYQYRYINSKLYDSIKKEYSKIRSEARKGVSLSEDHKKKISKSMTGHSTSEETRKLISDKAKIRKRKPFSDEYKKRQSEIMKKNHRWKNKVE